MQWIIDPADEGRVVVQKKDRYGNPLFDTWGQPIMITEENKKSGGFKNRTFPLADGTIKSIGAMTKSEINEVIRHRQAQLLSIDQKIRTVAAGLQNDAENCEDYIITLGKLRRQQKSEEEYLEFLLTWQAREDAAKNKKKILRTMLQDGVVSPDAVVPQTIEGGTIEHGTN